MANQGQPNFNTESSTPYDDAFRTLVIKGGKLVIPFLNAMFHQNTVVGEDTRIRNEENEHFIDVGNGKQIRIISDSIILVDDVPYHIECQSRDDGSILVRVAAYDWTAAMERSHLEGNELIIPLPYSGLLYLRKTAQTPEKMRIVYTDRDGNRFGYDVHVLCLADYTLDDLIRNELVLLLPFYLFNLEKGLREFDENLEARAEIIRSYNEMLQYLIEEYEKGAINIAQYLLVTDMLKKVTDSLARNEAGARKELDRIMGGKVLEFKGERLINEGRQEGRIEGIQEGKVVELVGMVCDGLISQDVAEKRAKEKYNVDIDTFREMVKNYKPDDERMQG